MSTEPSGRAKLIFECEIMKKRNQKATEHNRRSQLGLILFRFRKNKLAVISVFFLIFIAIVILSAPLYIDYDKADRKSVV